MCPDSSEGLNRAIRCFTSIDARQDMNSKDLMEALNQVRIGYSQGYLLWSYEALSDDLWKTVLSGNQPATIEVSQDCSPAI